MSISSGPRAVTSGLVFDYDIGNVQKSWKGGPNTNSYWNNGSPFDPWTAGGTNTNITGTAADDGPIRGAKTWKFNKSGSSNQWNGWEGTYGGIWTGSSGDIWTISYWYKTSSPAGATGFGIGSYYLSDWSRPYNVTIIDNVSTIIADGQWHYNYTIVRFNEAYTNAIVVDGPSWGYSTQSGELYINGLTWCKTAYAPPPYSYTFGTRSNTQSLLDLSGKNTITASSLTYNYNGSGFTFNGSSNYMDCGNASEISSITGTSNVTVESWVNLSGYGSSSYGVITHKGYPWAWLMENPSNTMRIRFYLSSSGDVSCSDSSTHALNTWYHFVGTYDGSNMRFYRNGVLTNTVAGSGTLGGSGVSMIVGSYGGAYFSQGQIPIVRIYNRTLSSEEVAQNFQALRGRFDI